MRTCELDCHTADHGSNKVHVQYAMVCLSSIVGTAWQGTRRLLAPDDAAHAAYKQVNCPILGKAAADGHVCLIGLSFGEMACAHRDLTESALEGAADDVASLHVRALSLHDDMRGGRAREAWCCQLCCAGAGATQARQHGDARRWRTCGGRCLQRGGDSARHL